MTRSSVLAMLSMLFVAIGYCGSKPLPEEQPLFPRIDFPVPFEAHTTVISCTPQRTVLDVDIDPLEPEHFRAEASAGLGLVAVSPTGVIEASVVQLEAARLTNLSATTTVSLNDIPRVLVTIGEPAIWRDLRVVTLSCSPVWEQSGTMYLARRLVVAVQNVGGTGTNEKSRPVQPISPSWDALYRDHVLNYQWLDLPVLERGNGNRYIVISRSRFTGVTPQFVEWKTRQGYGVKLVTLEELGYEYPADPEAIQATKDYIQTSYETWLETPEYVLLVGDIDNGDLGGSIYTEQFNNPFYGQGPRYYDQWYAFLEGEDLFPDIMVGRFPDTQADRMGYMLSKTIGYEIDQHVEGSWPNHAIMTLDSYIGPTIEAKNSVSDTLTDWGMDVSEYFSYPYNVIPDMNNGFTFYNYRGDYCGSTGWGGTFSSYDVAYVNNLKKLGIFTIISCSSACFDYSTTSTAELLLRHGYTDPANPKGALAFVGSQAYTAYQYNNPLDKGFYLAFTDEGRSILGDAFVSGKMFAWDNTEGLDQARREAMMKEYTILGDPSVQLWTDVPQPMVVAIDPPSLLADDEADVQVTVKTALGNGISGALVCLWRDSDVYSYSYTRGSAGALLSVHPEGSGELTLTVTAYNFTAHLGSVPVTGTPVPKLPENLTTQADGTSVLLSWDPVTEDVNDNPIVIDHYNVYRNNHAFFQATVFSLLGTSDTADFADADAAGDPSTNYFYCVRAVSDEGEQSAPSESVGEIDFQIIGTTE